MYTRVGLILFTLFITDVLDSYIFILPPRQDSKTPVPRVHSLLHMHDIPSMGIGLPKKGVCGSDHVAIGAVLDVRN